MNVKTAIIAIALAAFLMPAAAMANEYADDYYAYDSYASDYYPMDYYGEDDYAADYDAYDDYDTDGYAEDTYAGDYYVEDGYEDDEYADGYYVEDGYDEDYYAEDGYEDDGDWEANSLDAFGGIYQFGDRLEAWYSSQVAYHYLTPEWWVDDEGFYRTDEGYYVIAASDYEYGSVIDGSKGACFVADSGCEEGVSDYYVDW